MRSGGGVAGRRSFADAQRAQLQETFPSGVCDLTKKAVSQQPTIAWLTYQNRDGDVVYGGRPLGRAPPGSGSGWTGAAFKSWLQPER